MPQTVIPVPAGFRVTGRFYPPGEKGFVFTGFALGGSTLAGAAIPPYNFATDQGIKVKYFYAQRPEFTELFDQLETQWFYLTGDYLYQPIQYGPRVVTLYLEATIENTLATPIFLSSTAFCFEPYLKDLADALKAPLEGSELKIVR
jgi:hypothetical protein